MNSRTILPPLVLGLLLCSCPGEETKASSPNESNTDAASEDAQAFDAAVEKETSKIDAAAKAAGDEITDENAEAALEDLSKSIKGEN